MAEGLAHPGSFVGDSVEEFKKLPTWGKFAVGAGILIVGYLAYRARQGATAQQAAGTSLQSGLPATDTSGGAQSPFPLVNGVPVLPSGTNPIYDPSGGLVGYQGGNPPVGPATPGNSTNPLIPYGQLPAGVQYSNAQQLAKNPNLTWGGVTYKLNPGANGRLWGTPVNGGQQVLLYAPQNQYSGTGSGPMAGYMSNPNVYHQSAMPHLPSSVPQH